MKSPSSSTTERKGVGRECQTHLLEGEVDPDGSHLWNCPLDRGPRHPLSGATDGEEEEAEASNTNTPKLATKKEGRTEQASTINVGKAAKVKRDLPCDLERGDC
jgi:hypothetical protein